MADEILTVETPEHVELHFSLATLGNRFLACAIDHAIQLLALILTSFIAWRLSEDVKETSRQLIGETGSSSVWVLAVGTLITFVILFGYFIFFETFWNGQTPGKRWMKLRVIQDDGRPVTFFSSLARNVIRGADMMPIPFYSIGLIAVFTSARAKRLGDFVANTVVIKERESEAPTFDEIFEHEIIDSALRRIAPPVDFRGDVSLVSPSEILAVETFLRRRYDIPEQPRMWLAWRIAAPLVEKIKPRYAPDSFNFEGFLEELLARYRTLPKYRGD
ncbi:MAG: RDD family protein [Acidobacteriota bacterium]|nr:MAG: RDD family protein [Acidobacteriota bacterium]